MDTLDVVAAFVVGVGIGILIPVAFIAMELFRSDLKKESEEKKPWRRP